MSAFADLSAAAFSAGPAGFELSAPLKLNLALHVLNRRADGYHNLEMLAAFSPAGDRLHFCPAERDNFTASGAFAANIGAAADNLVPRARDSLRALLGARAVPPVAIHLRKNLPVAAGLGGGSADAAACLIGLCALNGIKAEEPRLRRRLMQLAADLGADVPMCLGWFYEQSACLAAGRGELLTALPSFPALPVLIINNGAALATAAVFARLEQAETAPLLPQPAVQAALARAGGSFADCLTFLRLMRNDLYRPALAAAPALAADLALLAESGAAFSAMSGSGGSCFGLYAAPAAAAAAADFVRRRRPGFFVLVTQTDGAPLPQ